MKELRATAKLQLLHISNIEFCHSRSRWKWWANATLGMKVSSCLSQSMKSSSSQASGFSRRARGHPTRISGAAIAILFTAFGVCPGAKAEVVVSRYAVTVSGLPTGEVILQTKYSEKQYEIAVSGDVGTIFDSTKIKGTASGSRTGVKLTPERFQVVFSGGEEAAIDVNFKGSGGTGSTINPRLRGVLDPLSALLLTSLKPVSQAGNPCNHVLPIFTGRARFDLSLHIKGGEEAQRRSVIVACEADYAATPGQPPEKLDWEIAFTKVPKPHFWLLEHIALPTPKGTVSIDRAETTISDS
jgi:Protein of unknown function (DUF3108)